MECWRVECVVLEYVGFKKFVHNLSSPPADVGGGFGFFVLHTPPYTIYTNTRERLRWCVWLRYSTPKKTRKKIFSKKLKKIKKTPKK